MPQLVGHGLLVLAVSVPPTSIRVTKSRKSSRRETCPSSTAARWSCSRPLPWQRPHHRKAKSLARQRARPVFVTSEQSPRLGAFFTA